MNPGTRDPSAEPVGPFSPEHSEADDPDEEESASAGPFLLVGGRWRVRRARDVPDDAQR